MREALAGEWNTRGRAPAVTVEAPERSAIEVADTERRTLQEKLASGDTSLAAPVLPKTAAAQTVRPEASAVQTVRPKVAMLDPAALM